jgi:hypothetical protein
MWPEEIWYSSIKQIIKRSIQLEKGGIKAG